VGLLRTVAKHNDNGIRLRPIAEEIGLHPATVHRILTVLTDEGLLTYDQTSRRYHLGIELFKLGSAARQFEIRDKFRSTIDRIAKETMDSVFLVTRSGYDSLCIDLVEGSTPIRIMSIDIGTRMPLGIGAGSSALLAFLPEKECEEILLANQLRYSEYNNQDKETIRNLLIQSRERGYTVSEGHFTPGVSAVGVPIFNFRREVLAAISVAAISQRMDHKRRKQIAQLIRSEITRITQV
jgi:DNA-binding IclR family transcriptional regulator